MIRRRLSAADDSGATLIIVLAFLAVFGLLIGVMLSATNTNMKRTLVTRSFDQKVYAADGGIDAAIVALRTNSTLCPTSGSTATLPDMTINQHVVSVTCKTVQGSALGANGYAVITTDPTTSSFTTSGGGLKKIGGPVFASGFSDAIDATIDDGDTYEHKSGSTCSSDADQPSNLIVRPTPPFEYHCTNQTWTSVDPAPSLGTPPTLHPLRTPDRVMNLGGGAACNIFRPGTYSNGIDLSGTDNYLASGVYYFPGGTVTAPDAGALEVTKANVVGGASGGESQINNNSACATDADLPAAALGQEPAIGTGVKIVLGGDSQLIADNASPGGQIELFTRKGGVSSEGTQGVSLMTVPSPAPAGWVASTRTLTDPAVQVQTGDNPALSVHGLVYMKDQFLDFNATNAVKAQLVGGIVVGRLAFHTSASAGSVGISIQNGSGQRRIELVATAHGDLGERDVVSRAVIDLQNDAARTVSIDSWWNQGN
jgi:hypothetical protein